MGVIATLAAPIGADHDVPLFPSAADPDRQGFVRIINHASRAGSIRLHATDDDGNRKGPLELSIEANEALHFNSDDLENGNAAKGLAAGTGPGSGNWRLELASDLDIEVLAYTRSAGGFLASMHGIVDVDDDDRYRVGMFNPADDVERVSSLRLVNAGADSVDVTITGTDDGGNPSSEVVVSVPGGASRSLTAQELESGGMFDGALGDGSGKWRLSVSAEGPITVMNLMEGPMKRLVNLGTAPNVAASGIHFVPLFPGTSDASGRRGLVRIINRSDRPGTVNIDASDESDADYEPVTLTLGADVALQFDADDLESGNADLGLAGGIGPGQGDWRLSLTSDLAIGVLAYVRTDDDGLLTPMQATAPESGHIHRIATFNPGSNPAQVSRLWLRNRGTVAAQVTVSGIDDRGVSTGPGARISVAPGRTETLAALELEVGGDAFEGMLGDGAGKWRLLVEADAPILAMSLLATPTDHLTNLSSVSTNFAPGNGSAFGDRAVGKRIVQGEGDRHIDFTAADRYRETRDGQATEGTYTYARTGRETASIEFESDDGTSCTAELTFESRISGRIGPCGATAEVRWRLLEVSRRDQDRITYELTAVIATLPSGVWTPDVVRGAALSVSDGMVRVEFENGGYVEVGEHRYACRNAGGCIMDAGVVRAGRILSTPSMGVRDFGLVEDNRSSTGLAHGDGNFYLVDAADRKVYVYDKAGQRIPARDFDLAASTHTAAGITFGDDRFYVVDELDILDESPRKVFVYDSSGQRLEEADFEISGVREPLGITYVDGSLFVADAWSKTVFAFGTTGERDTEAGFDLDASNLSPRGIAHGNGRFHVVDIFEDKVYVYRQDGERDAGRDFDLVRGNRFARGIEAVGDEFYVVDSRRVFAYPTDRPDLTIEAFSVDDTRPEAGQSLSLRATVRNVGHRRSEATTVSYYRSRDATINTRDDEKICDGETCEFGLESLAVNANARAVTDAEAPARSGRYYYGVCVEALPEESDPRNCSDTVRVTVAVDTGGATEGFVLDPDNGRATGMTYADDRFFVLDAEDDKVYVYRTTAERDPDRDFVLDADNSGAEAVVYANEKFYVADRLDDKVYAYTATGERDADADFDLADDNRSPNGIAYGNERFYIADLNDDKVYVYRMSGSRIPGADFGLSRSNDTPWALEFVDDRLYVVDNVDDRVYVYQTSGERITALEFGLRPDNYSPEGIALFDERFYVPDHYEDAVYGYPKPATME